MPAAEPDAVLVRMGKRTIAGVVVMVAMALVAGGVERRFELQTPAFALAGATAQVVVSASTDAGQGEQIGFLQVDVSHDGGRTWEPARYLDGLGATTVQRIDLVAGLAGTELGVRARVAFRGGLAGNVDRTGAAIRWDRAWQRWQEPAARSASIPVRAR